MFNIFLAVFFATLAFAFVEPYFFIGYLISIALFGLYQAIFMANAGGAWDNAKKIVEVELKEKGTPLHAATVVGDTVGDPFKDTSSVAMNPVIKFTTLFGLLAVELAVDLHAEQRRRSAACWPRSSSWSRWSSSSARSTACGSRPPRPDGTEPRPASGPALSPAGRPARAATGRAGAAPEAAAARAFRRPGGGGRAAPPAGRPARRP